MILFAVIGIALGLFSPAAAGPAAGASAGPASFHLTIDFSSATLIRILAGTALSFFSLALLSHPGTLRKKNLIHQ